jgi:hypothetical protein
MAALRITTGTVEPIQIFVVDDLGDPFTGKTDLFVRLRRSSDGEYLDWFDNTFKAAGWTTRDQSMTETDATLNPGVYEVAGGLDTSTNPTEFQDQDLTVIPLQTPGIDATLPAPDELKVGQFVDNLDQSLSTTETNIRGGSETLQTVRDAIDSLDAAVDECRLNVSFVPGGSNTMRLAAWLVRNGVNVVAPSAITLTWFNLDGTVSLFTLTAVDAVVGPPAQDPDANGRFRFVRAQALANDEVYKVSVAITDGVGTVTTFHDVQTVATA